MIEEVVFSREHKLFKIKVNKYLLYRTLSGEKSKHIITSFWEKMEPFKLGSDVILSFGGSYRETEELVKVSVKSFKKIEILLQKDFIFGEEIQGWGVCINGKSLPLPAVNSLSEDCGYDSPEKLLYWTIQKEPLPFFGILIEFDNIREILIKREG